MLVNARSLTNDTIDNLINILFKEEDVDVCCITETWLRPDDQAVIADIRLRGYDIISSPRKCRKGGGLAFLCKNLYRFKQAQTNTYTLFELLEVAFNCKSTKVTFSTIYRTGYLNMQQRPQFLTELNDYLESLIFKEGINIIWGDFNIINILFIFYVFLSLPMGLHC